MDQTRTIQLSKKNNNGKCIIYVMSRDQRAYDNHALIAAQNKALELKLPLIVMFNLLPKTGFRSYEHFSFMLDGLEQIATKLRSLNIDFILTSGSATKNIQSVINKHNPSVIYFDFSPLHGPRKLVKSIANSFSGHVYVVDTHNIIPVWVTSSSQEFAAHTIRNKIHKNLEKWLVETSDIIPHPYRLDVPVSSLSFDEAKKIISQIPKSGIKIDFESGENSALIHLNNFINKDLINYALKRNDIANDHQSNLSPYLHFGQISSLRVALNILKSVDKRPLLFDQALLAKPSDTPSVVDGMNALFEEMIVRKELSDNFCFYAKSYINFESIPSWAAKTLDAHKDDKREFIYSKEEWEQSKTHDPAFNAAQNQLLKTGKIHGYMRMYWAKKILEYSSSPEEALKIAIYLNDKYSIDGGDPNGYVGILWAIAGLHDRPWFERPVLGLIRYMNLEGLKRKFNVDKYISDNT